MLARQAYVFSLLQSPRQLPRGYTAIELVFVLSIVALLLGVAVPNFLQFRSRAYQAEAKANLKAYFASAQAYHALHGTYVCPEHCGFNLTTRQNRYTYDFGGGAVLPAAAAYQASVCPYQGPHPAQQSTNSFTATAAANLDSDGTCDSWSINEANVLSNDINDIDR